uniref:Uncharacterized protein n=1 Tax=Faecalibaculum rodentium TaxID=1702221 RepID=A0A140DVV3_9FIRM|nr:hypothetical protein AALO17_16460 [Faecalibaculum rodentium]
MRFGLPMPAAHYWCACAKGSGSSGSAGFDFRYACLTGAR